MSSGLWFPWNEVCISVRSFPFLYFSDSKQLRNKQNKTKKSWIYNTFPCLLPSVQGPAHLSAPQYRRKGEPPHGGFALRVSRGLGGGGEGGLPRLQPPFRPEETMEVRPGALPWKGTNPRVTDHRPPPAQPGDQPLPCSGTPCPSPRATACLWGASSSALDPGPGLGHSGATHAEVTPSADCQSNPGSQEEPQQKVTGGRL